MIYLSLSKVIKYFFLKIDNKKLRSNKKANKNDNFQHLVPSIVIDYAFDESKVP